jgi:hypothetical protein
VCCPRCCRYGVQRRVIGGVPSDEHAAVHGRAGVPPIRYWWRSSGRAGCNGASTVRVRPRCATWRLAPLNCTVLTCVSARACAVAVVAAPRLQRLLALPRGAVLGRRPRRHLPPLLPAQRVRALHAVRGGVVQWRPLPLGDQWPRTRSRVLQVRDIRTLPRVVVPSCRRVFCACCHRCYSSPCLTDAQVRVRALVLAVAAVPRRVRVVAPLALVLAPQLPRLPLRGRCSSSRRHNSPASARRRSAQQSCTRASKSWTSCVRSV